MVNIAPYKARLKTTKTYNQSDNPRGDFLAHLSELGYKPPKVLKDGQIDRISDPTDKGIKESGWYIYNQYENISIASYGTWKDGEKNNWTSKDTNTLSFAERIKVNDEIKKHQEQRKAEEKQRHEESAIEASDKLLSLESATNENPYLKFKQVKSCPHLRQEGEVLYMPVLDNDVITSYQKIYPDGRKKLKTGGRKKGCYFVIDGDKSTIYISEGLSTGLSVHEATGNCVYVAIDCGNLYEVSQKVKDKHIESNIILAGENNDANRVKCEQIELPSIFPPNVSHDDFNDMHVAIGLDAVREVLKPQKLKTKTANKINTGNNSNIKLGGVLDEIIDYYNATSGNNQPLFAIQTAFALCSILLSRNFVTNYSNKSSLYFLNLAQSGTGKEHGKKIIEKILTATDNTKFIGGDGFTSPSAVVSSLYHQPRQICVIDEFSKNIEASNAKNGNIHMKEANAKIMEVFGRLDGTLRNKSYSTVGLSKEKRDALNYVVKHPALTLFCMSTPEDFFNNVGEKAVKDGFLNRFLICVSKAEREIRKKREPIEVPQSIIQWVDIVTERANDDLTLPENEPTEIRINFDYKFQEEDIKAQQEFIDIGKSLEEFGLSEITMRSNEIAMRLSMIIALSENPNANKIETIHYQKALDWVKLNLHELAESLKMSVSGSEFEADKKIILKSLRKKPITRSDMHKRSPYSRYKTKDLNEILTALQQSGLSEVKEQETGGRPKILWTAT